MIGVLCRRTQQRYAADVDVLDSVRGSRPRLRDCLLERIKIHGNEIDWLNAGFGEHLHFINAIAPGQDSGKNLRMKCLNASPENLRLTGVVGDRSGWNALLRKKVQGSPG